MALMFGDRIKETTNTTGTGPLTLSGAVSGYNSFSSAMSIGDTCYYAIVYETSTDWEIGVGTLTSASVLQRTTILKSSAGGTTRLTLEAGTKYVYITLPKKHIDDLSTLITTIDGGSAAGN